MTPKCNRWLTVFGLVLFLASFGTASAQATRTWVSGVGDDANPCSRTAPCKTFAGAISKTAAGGIINALDPGGYGAVTITKSITIEAVGTVASTLASGTNGIIVNAAATDSVTLRGVSIDGAGTTLGLNGVRFLNGAKLVLEHCTIQNFSQNGVDFEPSSSAHLVITDSSINNIGGSGVLVQGGSGATATNVNATLERAVLANNGFGIQVTKGVATVKNSTVSGSTSVGIKALGSSNLARVVVDNTIITDNAGTGVNAQGSQGVVSLSQSTVSNNNQGISASLSGSVVSFGNNRNFGNAIPGAPTSVVGEQ